MKQVNLKPVYRVLLNGNKWTDDRVKTLAQDLVEGKYIENGRPYTINDYITVYHPDKKRKVDMAHPNNILKQYYKRAYAKKMREVNKTLREENRRRRRLDHDAYLDVDKMQEFEKYLSDKLFSEAQSEYFKNPLQYDSREHSVPADTFANSGLAAAIPVAMSISPALTEATLPVAASTTVAPAAYAAIPPILASVPLLYALRHGVEKIGDLTESLEHVSESRPEVSVTPTDIESVGVLAQTDPPILPEDPDNKSRKQRRKERRQAKSQSENLQEAREIMERQMRRLNGTERVHQLKRLGRAAANIAAADAVGELADYKIESSNENYNNIVNQIGIDNIDAVQNPQTMSTKDKAKILWETYGYDSDPEDCVELFGGEDIINYLFDKDAAPKFSRYSNAVRDAERSRSARDWNDFADRVHNEDIPVWNKIDDAMTLGIRDAAHLFKFTKFGYGGFRGGLLNGAIIEGYKQTQ